MPAPSDRWVVAFGALGSLGLEADDPEATVRTARLVKRLYPHLKVFARARNRHRRSGAHAEFVLNRFDQLDHCKVCVSLALCRSKKQIDV